MAQNFSNGSLNESGLTNFNQRNGLAYMHIAAEENLHRKNEFPEGSCMLNLLVLSNFYTVQQLYMHA